MTRVLSFEELSQLVPPWSAEEAFPDAYRCLQGALPEIPGFHGAVRFGSAATKRCNILSDLDILVVTSKLPESGQCNLGTLAGTIRSAYGIQVSFETVLAADAEMGCHSIGLSLMKHLRWCAEHPDNIIGKNPLSSLPWGPTIPNHYYVDKKHQELVERLRYLDFQERRLTQGMFLFDSYSLEQKLRFLGKILDAPAHITRRLFDRHEHHREHSTQEMLKILQDGCHLIEEQVPVCALLEELLKAKANFLSVVQEQLRHPSQSAYGAALRDIFALARRTLAFNQAVKSLFVSQSLL